MIVASLVWQGHQFLKGTILYLTHTQALFQGHTLSCLYSGIEWHLDWFNILLKGCYLWPQNVFAQAKKYTQERGAEDRET